MNVHVDTRRVPENGHAEEGTANVSIEPASAARTGAIFSMPHLQPRRRRNDLRLAGSPCNVPLQNPLVGTRYVNI